jgi:GPH family glycoside/pentoside/hexuronide:cation symporter
MNNQTLAMLPEIAPNPGKSCSLPQMLTYGLGECANSLVMNGVFGFALIFFTKALGLNPTWAGIAMSVSVVWEAIFEPIIGHISDNTRSRWGRRHPYMIVGGMVMALCSYMIWFVPEVFHSSQLSILVYVVVVNLVLRTGLTMFFIPYMALGFEMCSDYQGRAKLQSIRQILNMAANFAGPAMAWSLFFQDRGNIRGTTQAVNYLHMGTVFAISTAMFVLVVVVFTFHWHEDTRHVKKEVRASWVKDFFVDMKQILRDPDARWVFIFIFIVCAGMVLVSSLQIFVYDDYMNFSAFKKTIAHGGTMVGMALGAFVAVGLAKTFDKRNTILIGGLVSVLANLTLGLLFVTGLVAHDATWIVAGKVVPLAFCLFVPLHAAYWFGNGVMLPIANSMIADVSEIQYLKTGVKKDGGYSSVFSLSMRMAISLSLMASGCCLDVIGYKVPLNPAAGMQIPGAIWRLGAVTFFIGAFICLLSLMAIQQYPLTRSLLEESRKSRNSK